MFRVRSSEFTNITKKKKPERLTFRKLLNNCQANSVKYLLAFEYVAVHDFHLKIKSFDICVMSKNELFAKLTKKSKERQSNIHQIHCSNMTSNGSVAYFVMTS